MSTRRLGVLLLVAGALGTLATAAATWWTAPVDAVGSSAVSADGLTAVPLAGPLLLVVAAGVVARLLARGVLARIVDWLVVLAAAGLVQQLVAGAGRAESALATAAA
uniref:Trp biosynthesis-associated membrane protein n=1 Tax=Miniimonas arenae TaxID=676201 RepID=UPI0028AB3BD8